MIHVAKIQKIKHIIAIKSFFFLKNEEIFTYCELMVR